MTAVAATTEPVPRDAPAEIASTRAVASAAAAAAGAASSRSLLTQVPFVMSICYSLTDWKIVPPTPREFVGLENYTRARRRPVLPRRGVGERR